MHTKKIPDRAVKHALEADGNCLFEAVAAAMSHAGTRVGTAKKLRAETAAHLTKRASECSAVWDRLLPDGATGPDFQE